MQKQCRIHFRNKHHRIKLNAISYRVSQSQQISKGALWRFDKMFLK